MEAFQSLLKSTSIDYEKREITLKVRSLPRLKIVVYGIELPVGKGSKLNCRFVIKSWGWADPKAGTRFMQEHKEVDDYLFTIASSAFGNHTLRVNSGPKVNIDV